MITQELVDSSRLVYLNWRHLFSKAPLLPMNEWMNEWNVRSIRLTAKSGNNRKDHHLQRPASRVSPARTRWTVTSSAGCWDPPAATSCRSSRCRPTSCRSARSSGSTCRCRSASGSSSWWSLPRRWGSTRTPSRTRPARSSPTRKVRQHVFSFRTFFSLLILFLGSATLIQMSFFLFFLISCRANRSFLNVTTVAQMEGRARKVENILPLNCPKFWFDVSSSRKLTV